MRLTNNVRLRLLVCLVMGWTAVALACPHIINIQRNPPVLHKSKTVQLTVSAASTQTDEWPWDSGQTCNFRITKGSFTKAIGPTTHIITVDASTLDGPGVYQVSACAMGVKDNHVGFGPWSDPGAVSFTVYELNTLTVQDDKHTNNKQISSGGAAPDLYVGETTAQNALLDLIANVNPDTSDARAHVLWAIDGSIAQPGSGDFGANSTVQSTITPSSWQGNRDFACKAGPDSVGYTHSVPVHLVGFSQLTVFDKNHSAATVTADATTPACDLYIADGNAVITLNPTIANNTPAFKAHVLWAVNGATANPAPTPDAPQTFAATSLDIALTPAAANTDRKFVITAGVDLDGNGKLGTSEVQYTVSVVVVKLDKLEVRDKNHPLNTKTTSDGTIPDLWVAEKAVQTQDAELDLIATVLPATAAAYSHVDWRISDYDVSAHTGNFDANGQAHVTITQSSWVWGLFGGNRDFTIKAGVDADASGALDTSEITRQANAHLLDFNQFKVTDKNNNAAAVTLAPNTPAADLYICENPNGDTVVTITPAILNNTQPYRTHVLWKIDGATATQPNGSFATLNNGGGIDVTLKPDPASNVARTFIIRSGVDSDGNGTFDSGTGNPGSADVQYAAKVTVIKIRLRSVSFEGTAGNYFPVRTDNDNADYSAPHWLDVNLNGNADEAGDRHYPVAFRRNAVAKVSANFTMEPSNLSVNFKIKGDASGGLNVPETTATIAAPGDNIEIPATPLSAAFADNVGYLNQLAILWKVSVDNGGSWCEAGKSANEIFIVMGVPGCAKRFRTIMYLACKNTGATTPQECLSKTWTSFAGPANVCGWDDSTKNYSRKLYYYKGHFNGIPTSVGGMLADPDGDGNCLAWAQCLHESLLVNNVDSQRITLTAPSPASAFAVKTIIFRPPSFPANTPWQYASSDLDTTSDANLPGQNTTPPQEKIFSRHWIVQGIDGVYYDPSYGATRVSAADYTAHAIDAWRRGRFAKTADIVPAFNLVFTPAPW